MAEQKDSQILTQLVSADTSLDSRLKFHTKAMTEIVKGYPDRFPLAFGSTWQTLDRQNYHPVEYTAEKLLSETPPPWADPQDISKLPHDYKSYEGEVSFDTNGRPLNPIGPTGITGRGVLGRWGANFAVDAIVTRVNSDGYFEMVTIKREASGEPAIPGGFVDKGEGANEALKRELHEETTVTLDFENAYEIYRGYVDDPRNTDNAWIETDVKQLHLSLEDSQFSVAGESDAEEAGWKVMSSQLLEKLYASHAFNVKKAIAFWEKKEGKVVDSEGRVHNSTI